MDEAHVEHAVRFIEDEDLEPVELHGPLVDEVQEAAGGGDDDVCSVLEPFNLRRCGDAAEDDV